MESYKRFKLNRGKQKLSKCKYLTEFQIKRSYFELHYIIQNLLLLLLVNVIVTPLLVTKS